MRKKICLIVDNPLRDLDGMVLAARELSLLDYDVYLVPFYQSYEVYYIRPELVLLNYIRKNNLEFIKTCKDLGILTAVLDTEGAIMQNADQHFAKTAKLVKGNLDLYCFWGPLQMRYFSEGLLDQQVTLAVTGSPRHDLCHEKYTEVLAPTGFPQDRPIILINSNFPISHPRFQSVEKEAWNLVHIVGWPADFVKQWIVQASQARQCMIDTSVKLAEEFPQVRFVLRPHPFESKTSYEEAFSRYENLKVIQEGNVLSWIEDSMLIIHRNCSTAVEAAFMKKKSLQINWPHLPILVQVVPEALSLSFDNFDEMKNYIGDMLIGKISIKTSSEPASEFEVEFLKRKRATIADLYYSDDGQSASRLASVIDQLVKRQKHTVDKRGSVSVLGVLVLNRFFKEILRVLIVKTIGYKRFLELKIRLKNIKYDYGKNIDFVYVKKLNEALGRLAYRSGQKSRIEVHKNSSEHYCKSKVVQYSLQILKNEEQV